LKNNTGLSPVLFRRNGWVGPGSLIIASRGGEDFLFFGLVFELVRTKKFCQKKDNSEWRMVKMTV
jgi:hypothetical protein